jgi:hypothetical protein
VKTPSNGAFATESPSTQAGVSGVFETLPQVICIAHKWEQHSIEAEVKTALDGVNRRGWYSRKNRHSTTPRRPRVLDHITIAKTSVLHVDANPIDSDFRSDLRNGSAFKRDPEAESSFSTLKLRTKWISKFKLPHLFFPDMLSQMKPIEIHGIAATSIVPTNNANK